MAITIDDTKRIAIATQLAEMRALQNVLIFNDQLLMGAIDDANIRQRLQEMLEQDQKNLGILETVMIQYGVQGELKENVRQRLEDTHSLMEDSKLTLSEKVLQQFMRKHQQLVFSAVS